MKPGRKNRAARPAEAGGAAQRPLRRAMIAALLAVVLGAVLWLSDSPEQPAPGVAAADSPAPVPAPAPVSAPAARYRVAAE